MPTKPDRIETKAMWVYTGLWDSVTKGEVLAKWVNVDDPKDINFYTISKANRKHYQSKVIGGVYEITTYQEGDTSGMYIAGETGPKYKGRHKIDTDIITWQANRVTRETAAEESKLAAKAKDDELMACVEVLAKARRKLPFNQRMAFDVWVLNKLQGLR